MKKFITNKITLTFIGVITLFLLWTIVSLSLGHGSRVFPTPWATIEYTFILLGQNNTYLHIGSSLLRMIYGFLISALSAIILGMIVGNFTKVKHVFNPTIVALKAVPTAAFVFLFLVLMGAKNAPILVVVLITFPIVYESVVAGYSHISSSVLGALKVDGHNALLNNFSVKFPLALPYIIVGLASSFALSFKIEIMAEVISGSTSYGIGNIIRQCQQEDYSNLVPIFAYSFIAVLLMLIFSAISSLLKSKLLKQ